MAVLNGYASLDELKRRLGIDSDDTTDDEKLSNIVNAVSRLIDDETGRRFYAETETRTFTPVCSDLLFVHDLLSISASGLVADEDGDGTYETTWAATDYVLLPENAALDGKPYTMIEVATYGRYSFPTGVRKGVKITGSFGYSTATPPGIKELCLLVGEQVWARKDAVFGVIGAPGGTAIMQMAKDVLHSDPHLQMFVEQFSRVV